MSIVRMQKIAVLGLDEQRESIMSKLMDFGAVELVEQKHKLADESWRELVSIDEGQNMVSQLEYKINQAEASLRVLEKYDTSKAPLFKTRRLVNNEYVKEINDNKDRTEENVKTILRLEEKLKDIADKNNKLDQEKILITPWMGYGVPLQTQGTKKTVVDTGVIPVTTNMAELTELLEREVGGVVIDIINSDKDMNYITAISLKSAEEKVTGLLKQFGFNEISFKGFEGTVEENLERIEKEKIVLAKEAEAVKGELADMTAVIKDIEEYYDMLNIAAEKERVKSRILKTKKTFYLEGWIPGRYVDQAQNLLDGMGAICKVRDPEEGEEVPVLLNNSNFFTPFESITEMYSLPAYKGFDPTSIYAFFYALFFGMMLSDAGYGIVMTIGCFVILKKFDLEGTMAKMIKLFFYCGISTTFWGAMFGGWFGDIVQVFSRTFLGNEIVIKPIWFNPLDDPMLLLIFSLGLGVVHLFIGMGIKAYMQIKDGQWFEALCDEGFWYFTILGLLGWLAGGMVMPALSNVGMWLAIIGMAGLLLTGGRHNKGIGKITGGLGNIYNITSYMSDILSYARILALGLATGVIAQVVNTMGSLFGGGPVGFIILLVVFVFGHILNFAINVLGAFIHSSRLQYVEFFGKFYEDGGEPFDPFRKKTKYIKIQQEEE